MMGLMVELKVEIKVELMVELIVELIVEFPKTCISIIVIDKLTCSPHIITLL